MRCAERIHHINIADRGHLAGEVFFIFAFTLVEADVLCHGDLAIRQLDAMPLGTHRYRLVFLQDYHSGSFEERSQPKTLLMVREGKDWRIAGEWQGIRDLPVR